MSPETAGAVATDAVPPLNTGRSVHFTLPVAMSMANNPPRPVGLPPRIVMPAIVAGPQSLKPGLTVSFSAGAVLSGWMADGSDCANVNAVQSAAPTIAPTPQLPRYDALTARFRTNRSRVAANPAENAGQAGA